MAMLFYSLGGLAILSSIADMPETINSTGIATKWAKKLGLIAKLSQNKSNQLMPSRLKLINRLGVNLFTCNCCISLSL